MLRTPGGKEYSNMREGYLFNDVARGLNCDMIDIKRFMAHGAFKLGKFPGRIDYDSYGSGLAKLGNISPGVKRNGSWFDSGSFPNGKFAFLKALKIGTSGQQLSKEQLSAMSETTGKTHFTVELKGSKNLTKELSRNAAGGFISGISGVKRSKEHFSPCDVKSCYLADSVIDSAGKLCGESLEALYSNAEAFNGFKAAVREIVLKSETSFSLSHKVEGNLKPISIAYTLKNESLFNVSEIDQIINETL